MTTFGKLHLIAKHLRRVLYVVPCISGGAHRLGTERLLAGRGNAGSGAWDRTVRAAVGSAVIATLPQVLNLREGVGAEGEEID